MKNHGIIETLKSRVPTVNLSSLFGWSVFWTLLLLPAVVWAQDAATQAMSVEYRDIPGVGSRNVVWVVAQQHLLLAGFVLGVPIFAWVCEIVGWKTKEARYDKLAKEFTKLLTSAYATTALFGGILLFLLIGLYPKLMAYLSDIFFPSFIVYCILFLLETVTLYLYWYGWDAMQGSRKTFHLFLGFLLNVFALFIMIVPNAWATFQASPVVVAEGTAIDRAWAATWNPTWWPVNIHRLIANVVLGGFICGAYAGIRYLLAASQEEREHYDWMGYVGNFIGVFGMLPLPFAGYWLMREIYQYNQQMGITLMGGFLAWLFILQAMLIGVLFLGANYYFWMGITYRIPGSERTYKRADPGHAGRAHGVSGRLDDPTLPGGQPGGSQKNGRDPSPAARGVRSDVRQNDGRQSDDPGHVHEFHHVLAGRQAGNGRLGQNCQSRDGRPVGACGDRGDRARGVGVFRPGHYPDQLFLGRPGVDRPVRDGDLHAPDGRADEKRQNHDGNGLGADADPGRLFAGLQCRYGHPVDVPDGLCALIVPGALARVRRDERYLGIRLFARVGGTRPLSCPSIRLCFVCWWRLSSGWPRWATKGRNPRNRNNPNRPKFPPMWRRPWRAARHGRMPEHAGEIGA